MNLSVIWKEGEGDSLVAILQECPTQSTLEKLGTQNKGDLNKEWKSSLVVLCTEG